MNRPNNWPELLAVYLNQRRDMPFEWGVNDCCLFALGWARMCGYEIPVQAYDSALGAARVLDDMGGIEQAWTAHFGEPIDINRAQRGDVALIEYDDRMSVGIVIPGGIVAPGKESAVIVPSTDALKAWGV